MKKNNKKFITYVNISLTLISSILLIGSLYDFWFLSKFVKSFIIGIVYIEIGGMIISSIIVWPIMNRFSPSFLLEFGVEPLCRTPRYWISILSRLTLFIALIQVGFLIPGFIFIVSMISSEYALNVFYDYLES